MSQPPEVKSKITSALASLSTTNPEVGTIISLLLLQDHDLNNIFKIYTKDEKEGLYGNYFDNTKDDIVDDNLWQVFEMER